MGLPRNPDGKSQPGSFPVKSLANADACTVYYVGKMLGPLSEVSEPWPTRRSLDSDKFCKGVPKPRGSSSVQAAILGQRIKGQDLHSTRLGSLPWEKMILTLASALYKRLPGGTNQELI